MEIKFFNRNSKKIEQEIVYGDKAIEWLYSSASGKILSPLITSTLVSKFFGLLQNTKLSAKKIPQFIKQYKINMDDFLYEYPVESDGLGFSNFNSFFIRKFKNGKRQFATDKGIVSAFAEARYFGVNEINDNTIFPVKGVHLNPLELLQQSNINAQDFVNGPLLVARLCPVDYHRFHFPCDGEVLSYYNIDGVYESVNPLALKYKSDIFLKNKRSVTIIQNQEFGKMALIDVGATFVGSIIQSSTLESGTKFIRGNEKGYFLFGGSTVILIGEKNRWKVSDDIISNTLNGIETYIHLGDDIGFSLQRDSECCCH